MQQIEHVFAIKREKRIQIRLVCDLKKGFWLKFFHKLFVLLDTNRHNKHRAAYFRHTQRSILSSHLLNVRRRSARNCINMREARADYRKILDEWQQSKRNFWSYRCKYAKIIASTLKSARKKNKL